MTDQLRAVEQAQRPDGSYEVAYLTVPGQRARVLVPNAQYHSGTVSSIGRHLLQRRTLAVQPQHQQHNTGE